MARITTRKPQCSVPQYLATTASKSRWKKKNGWVVSKMVPKKNMQLTCCGDPLRYRAESHNNMTKTSN